LKNIAKDALYFVLALVYPAAVGIAYLLDIHWIQLLFLLHLSLILYLVAITTYNSFILGSAKAYASLSLTLYPDKPVYRIDMLAIQFITYVVPFSLMLICVGEQSVSIVYLITLATRYGYLIVRSTVANNI
jgi:hypothetical protein